MTTTMHFAVTGEQAIHCDGCEQRITRALEHLDGVQAVEASAQTQHISVETGPAQIGPDQLHERLALLGYDITDDQTA